jgi:hypothetical protein
VLKLIRELEAQLHPVAPAPAPVLVVPPAPLETAPAAATEPAPATAVFGEEKPPSRPLPGAVWWLGGSAVATGVAGTVLGVLSSSSLSGDHPIELADGDTIHHLSPSQYSTDQTEGLAADILWGVGGALLVTAIVVALTR